LLKEFVSVYRPTIKRKDLEYVLNTMVEDKIAYGEYAKVFERKLYERTGSYNVIAVNSIFSALSLIFQSLDVKSGDEVILPSFAPQVYLNFILLYGAVPKLVDMEENSYRPSITMIRDSISEKTKLVILYYYFGYTYDPSPYIDLFHTVVEDISSVIGAGVNGEKVGSKSQYAIADFSSKSLITTGDGAAVFCNSRKNYHFTKSLIENEEYSLDYKPRNYCLMPDLNASMGISQIETLDHKLKLRESIGKIYEQAALKGRSGFISQEKDFDRYYSDFPIIVKSNLKDAQLFLKKYKIEGLRPFAYPLHQYLNLPKEKFPVTEYFYLTTLLAPNYSSLTKTQVTEIAKVLASMI